MTLEFNGRNLIFDKIYYFSPSGDDINGDGTELSPFKTPNGVISHGLLLENKSRDLCFVLDSGIYNSKDIWFNADNVQIVDSLKLTILSYYPERTVIKTNFLINLNYIGAVSVNINIIDITIDWEDINYNPLINFKTENLPITNIKFSNVLLNIGKSLLSYKWFFTAGYTQRGTAIFENCIINATNLYTLDSINKTPDIVRGITIKNSIINEKIQINLIPNFILQENCLIVQEIIKKYLQFPISQNISHKGSNIILNPDGGISHLGVCGGENAWHFDTYWYKFSSDLIIDKISLEQVKQHYILKHYYPGESLCEQIRGLEEDIDTKGNKVLSYILNSVNTYNILDFIESPHEFHYLIDEDLLGNFDNNDIHKVLLDITTPIYNNSQLFIYKNGILLKENVQYDIKNKNQILLYSLNLGDEIYLYIGWENYLKNIHINYILNEDGTESNRIKSIICENIFAESKYNYDINNKIISQILLNKNDIVKVKNYSYDKSGRLNNIFIK